MPYTIAWHTQNMVAHAQITGHFTADEVVVFTRELRQQYLDQGQSPIHLILDVRDIQTLPSSAWVIHHALNTYCKHPALGWIAFMTHNTVLTIFLEAILQQITPKYLKRVQSVEQAQSLLQQLDARLVYVQNSR